jgi:hypothetical protein
MRVILFVLFISGLIRLSSQTSIGIGLYPTGSEAGIGLRSSKNALACLDARVSKVSFLSKSNSSSMLSELSVVFRIVKLEKVRFHLGLGARAEFNFDRRNRYGAVIPIGVEAFPFPFQNAGLIFEVAPFYTVDDRNDYVAGLRTVAGFVFYFQKKTKEALTN